MNINDEDFFVMLWLYEDFIKHGKYFKNKEDYIKGLYDEIQEEDDEQRIEILTKMIKIIKR